MRNKFVEIKFCDIKHIAQALLNIIDDYDFDTVVCISKSGYLVGKELSLISESQFLEIESKRLGVDEKSKYLPQIVNKFPKNLIYFLKKYERKISYYDVNEERTLYYDEDLYKKVEPRKILIFDDAIDTGYTIDKVTDKVKSIYSDANIKTAVLNYYTDRNVNAPDYYLYSDAILSAPWTIDSKEFPAFIKLYKNKSKK